MTTLNNRKAREQFHKYVIAPLLFLFTTSCPGQSGSIQNLYFVPIGREVVFGDPDYLPKKSAFYLYRNCIYNFRMKDKEIIRGLVTDIKGDLIFCLPMEFGIGVLPERDSLVSFPPSALHSIIFEWANNSFFPGQVQLEKYRAVFENSDSAKIFQSDFRTVDREKYCLQITYEEIPALSSKGITRLSFEKSRIYDSLKLAAGNSSKGKRIYRLVKMKWIGFTPSNATKIEGLNIGLQTINLHQHPLTIEGVNLNADVVTALLGYVVFMHVLFDDRVRMMQPDTLSDDPIDLVVKGVSISGGGLLKGEMNGFSINGVLCGTAKSKGLVITGMQNFTEQFEGVQITGLINRNIRGRGLQIGLVNYCTNLRGFQLGLWNVNGKRRMPFINWQFRSNKT